MITIERYYDFSYGHRVYGHENKCSQMHGHNGRITFTLASVDGLDSIGRVLDFSHIKSLLEQWVEDNWDHKFLICKDDPLSLCCLEDLGIVVLPFNPTAELLAKYLVEFVGPFVLPQNIFLVKVKFEETRKCSASFILEPIYGDLKE
jgi:6-pyruvoyltetrahydropterin/6-carboxytetrahydropterin synthase